MTMAASQLLFDQRVIAVEKDELHVFADAQLVPISVFQGRTGQDRVFTPGDAFLNQLTQFLEPRPSILTRQRNAASHFFNIDRRMKVIRLIETPVEFVSEQLAQCGFSRAGNTENDHDHGALICRWRPIFSTRNATATKRV